MNDQNPKSGVLSLHAPESLSTGPALECHAES